jgi:GT2 family glycosyltransferase
MIYIIVPTFARVDDTKKFIESISKSIEKRYLILIIDDHPDKITYNSINEKENLKIITSNKELWWVGSINLGIKLIFDYNLQDTDIVIFANNDVQIDKKNFELLYSEIMINNNQIIHPRTIDQDANEVSSGAKIKNYFPYITKHPKNFQEQKTEIDMGTARFLMMSVKTLKTIGYINQDLVQYLGDNDFTLKAKRIHGISTYILKDAICKLDDTATGVKNNNIKNIKELWNSFFSIKSPNNIKYRYIFFKSHFNSIFSLFITFSMTLNSILKFIIGKIK